MRVYGAYSKNVQFTTRPASNYCQSAIMRGGLATIILTYINIFIFIGIFVVILFRTRVKRQQQKQIEMEMVETNNNYNRI
jgi:hypothetical protein